MLLLERDIRAEYIYDAPLESLGCHCVELGALETAVRTVWLVAAAVAAQATKP